jgi:cytoskeletal protein CcmA (bactofilin family)
MGMLDNWLAQTLGALRGVSSSSAGGTPPSALGATAESALVVTKKRERNRDYSVALSAADWATVNSFLERPNREASNSASCLDGELTVGAHAVLTSKEIIQCKTLRVFGTLDAPIFAQRLIVENGAKVKSIARVGEADISGTFDGTLQVHGVMRVHSGGVAIGKLRALSYEVAKDGVTSGDMKRVVPKSPEWIEHEENEHGDFDFPSSMMSMTMTKRAA